MSIWCPNSNLYLSTGLAQWGIFPCALPLVVAVLCRYRRCKERCTLVQRHDYPDILAVKRRKLCRYSRKTSGKIGYRVSYRQTTRDSKGGSIDCQQLAHHIDQIRCSIQVWGRFRNCVALSRSNWPFLAARHSEHHWRDFGWTPALMPWHISRLCIRTRVER